MYKIKLIVQKLTDDKETKFVENTHEWETYFDNDREARSFLKKAEVIQINENKVQRILEPELENREIIDKEPLLFLTVYNESEISLGENIYRKKDYKQILDYIEETIKKEH